jgi:hypothetical protein
VGAAAATTGPVQIKKTILMKTKIINLDCHQNDNESLLILSDYLLLNWSLLLRVPGSFETVTSFRLENYNRKKVTLTSKVDRPGTSFGRKGLSREDRRVLQLYWVHKIKIIIK